MTSRTAPPDVIVIVAHDVGDHLGCYGRKVSTPNLDLLAREGVRFVNHFSTSTVCAPSRASLITGQHPQTNGLLGLRWVLPAEATTDAEIFSRAGYRTHLVGFQHERATRAELGFDELHGGDEGFSLEVVTAVQRLMLDLGRQRARGASAPVYVRVGTYSAHRISDAGYGYDVSYSDQISASEVEIFPPWLDTPALRSDLSGFTGEVHRLDLVVGGILDAIRANGSERDTVVAFVSDHGIDYPRAKSTLYDLGIKTALILHAPGILPGGSEVTALTSHIDLLPTLLDLCGLDTETSVQGVTLVDLIRGRIPSVHESVLAEESTAPRNVGRCIRTTRHKLIRNFVPGPASDAQICGERPIQGSGDHYLVHRPEYELYDLDLDPDELVNRWDDPAYAGVRDDLRARLESHLTELEDPALSSGIRRPYDPTELLSEALRTGIVSRRHFGLMFERC